MNLSDFLQTYGGASVSAADRRRFDALYASFQRMGRRIEKNHDVNCFGMGCNEIEAFPEYDQWVEGVGLPVLGEGLFRIVLDLGDGRVLKLEKGMGEHTIDGDDDFWNWNGKPSASSLGEIQRWGRATPRQRAHLVPLLGYDPKGRWVVMPKVVGLMDKAPDSWVDLDAWAKYDNTMRRKIPTVIRQVAAQMNINPLEVRPINLDTSFRLLDYGT
jgi:hypothetical protein